MASSESLPDASETRAPVVIGVVVLQLLIATLMVVLRVWCRTLTRIGVQCDDIAAVITLVSSDCDHSGSSIRLTPDDS